ncbi:MAG TPA: tetratricopeptide repeat protein [Gemmata sp.]|nr:tetratricopeptide repeat protein [Gemmata sp.]
MSHPVRGSWHKRDAIAAAIALLCAGLAVAGCRKRPAALQPDPSPSEARDSSSPDPRVAFATPFRNVRPEVKYVGDASCTRCHKKISESFHRHPMGRSAEWIGRAGESVEHSAGANNPFTSSIYRLQVERKGDRVVHRVGLAEDRGKGPEYVSSADLAIGSGAHGRSYFAIDRGAVWQSPISWFSQAAKWDVSPGFNLAKLMRRPVISQCVHCHTDRPEPIPESQNLYREPFLATQTSIGCERCHGPGELHVAERSDGSSPALPDHSIVNPAHLEPELKADVCRQCHLQGMVQVTRRDRDRSEYRPGLPWEQFASTFLRHPKLTDYRRAVGQFEQMEVSRCFAGSGGKLSCISCHDPHSKPAETETAAYFREKCLSCHKDRGCSLAGPQRQDKKDSCIACHMPTRGSSNVVHVAITDHRIMRRPDEGTPQGKMLSPGEMPLVAYHAGPHAPEAAERERDLAIALGNEFVRSGTSPDRWDVVEFKLDSWLQRHPGDWNGWITRSRMFIGRGEARSAVEAAHRAVELHPDSETALVQLAGAAVDGSEYKEAVEAASRLIALNPSSSDHRLTRASAYFFLEEWDKTEADCRAAIAIHPIQANARFMLAVCRHKRGDAESARQEIDLALKMTPDDEGRTRLAKMYDAATRPASNE